MGLRRSVCKMNDYKMERKKNGALERQEMEEERKQIQILEALKG